MAIELMDKIKPKGGGNFPMIDAADVEMPDGTRLSEFKPDLELTEEQIAALKGQDGKDGVDGKDGADGYTPVKGQDYWTDADKQEIVEYSSEYVGTLFVSVTQDEYDNLFINGQIDPNKYYFIVGESV